MRVGCHADERMIGGYRIWEKPQPRSHTQLLNPMSVQRIRLSPSQQSFIDEEACRAAIGSSIPECHDENRPQKRRKLDPDDPGWFLALEYEFDCPFLDPTSAGSGSATPVISTSDIEASVAFNDPIMTVSHPGTDRSLFAFVCQEVEVTPLEKIVWLQTLVSKDSPITPSLRFSTTASIRESEGLIQGSTVICRLEIRFDQHFSPATKISLKDRVAILDGAFARPSATVNADRFYAHIGKLPTDYIVAGTEHEIQHRSISCQLFPFQKRAVAWMLQREGLAMYRNSDHVVDEDDLAPLWERVRDLNNCVLYVNRHQGLSANDNTHIKRQVIHGGILAEVFLAIHTI